MRICANVKVCYRPNLKGAAVAVAFAPHEMVAAWVFEKKIPQDFRAKYFIATSSIPSSHHYEMLFKHGKSQLSNYGRADQLREIGLKVISRFATTRTGEIFVYLGRKERNVLGTIRNIQGSNRLEILCRRF